MRYEVSVKFHKDFVEVNGNQITVGVLARPEKGKANDEIARKLARHFGVSRSAVSIVSGATGRKKIIDIGK
ncbi:MAG: DUF167 domain-containing protein [Patescibacteria group bacterium]|nr:DUF167 domain-containing protein [Patescibacteria group bacterium]MDE2015509.1 DUF167 domain-containing protein [Patescibacteria group bacterium]MDE2226875.1 DUF167 domain-containing protein [Patescibacteria group bacterium]